VRAAQQVVDASRPSQIADIAVRAHCHISMTALWLQHAVWVETLTGALHGAVVLLACMVASVGARYVGSCGCVCEPEPDMGRGMGRVPHHRPCTPLGKRKEAVAVGCCANMSTTP
jgi:hypothetical protein